MSPNGKRGNNLEQKPGERKFWEENVHKIQIILISNCNTQLEKLMAVQMATDAEKPISFFSA